MTDPRRAGRHAWTPANLDGLPANAPACRRCGGTPRPATVETAFWRDGRLVLVRGVPALVCPHCGDEAISAATNGGLARLWDRREEAEVIDQMIVPVFAWDDALLRAPEADLRPVPGHRRR